MRLILSRVPREIQGQNRRQYGANVMHLDDSVGKILAALERSGKATNTLVVFSSDNGPEVTSVIRMRKDYGHDGARPWRGMKRDDWEGGHRVPAIAWWPGRIRPGVSDQLAISIDLMPTFLDLAGARAAPREGWAACAGGARRPR